METPSDYFTYGQIEGYIEESTSPNGDNGIPVAMDHEPDIGNEQSEDEDDSTDQNEEEHLVVIKVEEFDDDYEYQDESQVDNSQNVKTEPESGIINEQTDHLADATIPTEGGDSGRRVRTEPDDGETIIEQSRQTGHPTYISSQTEDIHRDEMPQSHSAPTNGKIARITDFFRPAHGDEKGVNSKQEATSWRSKPDCIAESQGLKMGQLDSKGRRKYAVTLMKKIKAHLTGLEQCGYHTLLIAVEPDSSRIIERHSEMLEDFIQEQDLALKALAHVTRKMQGSAAGIGKGDRSIAVLREEVQDLFNKKYAEASGKPQISYKAVQEGQIVASGLPDGLPLKRPSAYGKANLQKILQKKSGIHIQDGNVAQETNTAKIETCMLTDLEVESGNISFLREEVQQLFNNKYAKSSGKHQISYKAVQEGRIVAFGLPDGLQLKRPSAYGKANLQKILEKSPAIHIQDYGRELFTTAERWPDYSDQVRRALEGGRVIEEWEKFIAETAGFILRHGNPTRSTDYSRIGRLVCERYPCVQFEEHGKTPWHFFVKRLSQKIRHIRWSRKRKGQFLGPGVRKQQCLAVSSARSRANHTMTEVQDDSHDMEARMAKDPPDPLLLEEHFVVGTVGKPSSVPEKPTTRIQGTQSTSRLAHRPQLSSSETEASTSNNGELPPTNHSTHCMKPLECDTSVYGGTPSAKNNGTSPTLSLMHRLQPLTSVTEASMSDEPSTMIHGTQLSPSATHRIQPLTSKTEASVLNEQPSTMTHQTKSSNSPTHRMQPLTCKTAASTSNGQPATMIHGMNSPPSPTHSTQLLTVKTEASMSNEQPSTMPQEKNSSNSLAHRMQPLTCENEARMSNGQPTTMIHRKKSSPGLAHSMQPLHTSEAGASRSDSEQQSPTIHEARSSPSLTNIPELPTEETKASMSNNGEALSTMLHGTQSASGLPNSTTEAEDSLSHYEQSPSAKPCVASSSKDMPSSLHPTVEMNRIANGPPSRSEDTPPVDSPLNAAPPEDQSKELFIDPQLWPEYSDRVMWALKQGQVAEQWNKFISETAFFILRYQNPATNEDYSRIGRLVCDRYPCVRFEEPGKRPWNIFVKKLSQKIRNIRWDRKRRAQLQGFQVSNPQDLASAGVQITSDKPKERLSQASNPEMDNGPEPKVTTTIEGPGAMPVSSSQLVQGVINKATQSPLSSGRHPTNLSFEGWLPQASSDELFAEPGLWPGYSDQVMGALERGRVAEEWKRFIAETASFIVQYQNPTQTTEYSRIGRRVCERYPCVKFVEPGKPPWNFFVRKLSQKIRHIRWSRKKKLTSQSAPTIPKGQILDMDKVVFEDDKLQGLNNDLLEEMSKDQPDKTRLLLLQRETFQLRRQGAAPPYHSHPFLLEEPFIIEEFNLLFPGMDLERYKQNWHSVKQGLLTCARQENIGIAGDMGLLLYLDTKVTAGQRTKRLMPPITVADATTITQSFENEAPRLVVFRHADQGYHDGMILFDGRQINLHDRDLLQMVLFLSQCYYAWRLTYPPQYQLLGFLQLFLLKDNELRLKKSTYFLKFQKRLEGVS